MDASQGEQAPESFKAEENSSAKESSGAEENSGDTSKGDIPEEDVPEGNVPDRCRRCAHWLGRRSGNPRDQRCNRRWGHEARFGDFTSEDLADEPFSRPAYVKRDCRVPQWGVPLPPVSESGRPVGKTPDPNMIDAFLPAGSGTICLQANRRTYELDAHQLQQYLMADKPEKEELLESFDRREEKRTAIEEQTNAHYKGKYGTNPKVREGMKELPPWKRSKEKVTFGILPLDAALNGGVEPGTAINFSGNPDAGKSTLAYALAGAHIRYYRQKVYELSVDAMLPDGGEDAKPEFRNEVETLARERAEGEQIALINNERFDTGYATEAMNLGSPLFESELSAREIADQSLRFIDTEYVEEAMQSFIEAIDIDSKDFDEKRKPHVYSWMPPITFRALIWDSIDAGRLAEEHLSGKGQEKIRMGDESRMGTQSRLLAEFFRKSYKASDIPCSMGMVSQYRANIGSYGGGKSPHRGNAHPYFTDLEMDVYTSATETKKLSGDLKSVHVRFEKVHVDSNVTESDEVQLYLRPGKGYDPIDNAIGYCLNEAEQKTDATNGVDCLWRNSSWVYYIPPGEEEPARTQGTDPSGVYEDLVKETGSESEFYDQLLSAVSQDE